MIALLLAATLAAAPTPRLGEDVVIAVPTAGPVVALAGSVRVAADVEGDVVAVGGDVEIVPGARVRGDAVALGGSVSGTGAVAGRAVSLSAFGFAGDGWRTRETLGLGVLRVGGWMIVASLLVLFAPSLVRRTADGVGAAPLRTVAVGAIGLLAWLAVLLLGLAAASTPLGLIVAVVSVAVFLIAKVVGMAAVALVVGRWLSPVMPLGLRGELPGAGVAMALLGAFAFVPLLGGVLWAAANLVAVGAAVAAAARPHLLVLALARAQAR